mgnify:CR=1 FL=1
MGANSTGIAGAPGQIADGVNPDYVAQVFPDLSVSVRFQGIGESGSSVAPSLGTGNRLITAERAMFAAILQELRIMNYLLATGLNVREDLDGLRREPNLIADTDPAELEN